MQDHFVKKQKLQSLKFIIWRWINKFRQHEDTKSRTYFYPQIPLHFLQPYRLLLHTKHNPGRCPGLLQLRAFQVIFSIFNN